MGFGTADTDVAALQLTDHTALLTDTAGGELFRPLISSYFKNVRAVIIVFDVTSRESMLKCKNWVQMIVDKKVTDCVLAAVGNKTDITDKREVSTEEGRAYFDAMSPSLPYFETSAKTGEGVDELLDTVVGMVLEKAYALCGNDNATIEDKVPEGGGGWGKCIIC